MNVYGQLLRAQLEKRASDHASSLDTGIWYNSTDEQVKISKVGAIRAFLLNDNKAIFGLDGTLADNVRLHRSGDQTLQIVPGNDTTADGSNATTLAKISAKFESYTTAGRPAFGNVGRVIFDTDEGQLFVDTGTAWAEMGGGGGGEIPNVRLGENIPAGRAVFLWQRPCFVVTTSNNWVDVNQGAGDVSFQIPVGVYLYDNDENRDEFHTILETAFDNSAATGTLTVSFSKSTRKITLDTSAATTWKWNTGTHGAAGTDTHIGTLLGYSDAADSASVTTLTAANEVTSTLSKKEFMYQTDADYTHKSRGYRGFLDTAGSKYDLRSLMFDVEGNVFSGKTETNELFTARASITITTGTNDKLDFNDGADRNATLAAGTYPHPYTGLLADIKAKMDALSAIDFTATYNNDTDKITIAGTGAFTLEWATGANTATGVHTTLGYTVADTASGTSHTAQNSLDLKGQLLPATNARINQNSVYGGFARSATIVHCERDNLTKYIPVVNQAGGYLAAPEDLTPGYDVAFGAQATNSVGQAVRAFWDRTSSPEVLRFQYRTSPNGPWVTSATTATPATDGSTLFGNSTYDDTTQNTPGVAPHVVIDDNGKAFCAAAAIWNAAPNAYQIRGFYSNDGGATWTKVTGSGSNNEIINDGTNSYYLSFLVQRGNKVIFGGSNTIQSAGFFGYSEDSGSGYTTATNTSTSGHDSLLPVGAEIQHFPSETGVDQYRYVMMGRALSSTTTRITYCKADLSSIATINHSVASLCTLAVGREGNRIVFLLGSESGATLRSVYTNDTYNGGTLTATEGADQNGGGSNISYVNGFRASVVRQLMWNINRRMVVKGGRAWAVVQHNFTNIHRYQLWTCSDVTTNTWTNAGETIGSDTTNQQGEMSVLYVEGNNSLMFVWKRGTNSTTLSQNLTNGQIFARIVDIEDAGATLSYREAEQIDNAEALGTYQGGISAAAHADGIGISWIKSTNIVRSQKFA